ncbi:MAG: PQQ-dependent sugar dehydrogenase [Pseudomonadota bacterium]
MRHRSAGFRANITTAFLAMAVALGAATAASPGSAASMNEAPGTKITVDPASLPAPYATDAASNAPEAVARPSPPPFLLPAGFKVDLFAGGLDRPRWLAVAPDGAVLVAESAGRKVLRLFDRDGDGKAEDRRVLAHNYHGPFGLAVREGQLYVADTDGVWRQPYKPDETGPASRGTRITPEGAFGPGHGHWTRNLLFSPDGTRFFVAIGSASNAGPDPLPRASVQSFAADGSDQRTYASGLRNPVGMAFYPGTNDLYTVVNERDGLGDGLVPDYLTRLQEGGFYGWPYFYVGDRPQPDLPAPAGVSADKVIHPDLLFRAHSAPLGLVFYEGVQFPPAYRGDAFVALHGSWNASQPQGYMVVRVPFANGRPAGWYEPFLTGFWREGTSRPKVWGRPVGLAIASDGSLLVADDLGGAIWRVSWVGTP